MALSGTDIAILSARFGVARFGASRFGFVPDDVEGESMDEPGEYIWKQDKPADTVWTLQSLLSFCISVPPTAAFTSDATLGGNEIFFTDASVAGDGTITNYLWDFGDGTTSTLKNPSHVYTPPPGSFVVRLTVRDDLEESDNTSAVVVPEE